MLTAMVQLHNVSYETPNRHLFHDVSFSINPGDRIGLVGLNGVGKTTLLSIVNGDIEQTSGSILSSGETIGIVPQDMSAWLDRTVYDFLEEATGVKQVREQLEERCRNLAIDSSEKSLLLYAEVLEKYNKFETSSFDTNIERALTQAGLARINGDYKIGDLSGGQRARIALAAIFAAKYDVILLDEPTNNLDQSGVAMLEEFIKSSPASFLIVSHDRRFLRNVTTQIIELTYGDKGIRQYSLGYDEYVEARKREKESIVHAYEQYEREKRRLRRVARDARIRANSASSNRHTTDRDRLTNHFRKERAASHLAGASIAIGSRLDRLEEPERPEEDIVITAKFSEHKRKRSSLLSVRDLVVSHDGIHTIGSFSCHIRAGDKILLSGMNGSGKTSLMKAIVNREKRQSGDVWFADEVGVIYIDQDQTLPLPDATAIENLQKLAPSIDLHDAINLLMRFNLRKDTIRTTLGRNLSGGERAKVLLSAMIANDGGLLILDEPTNNLDIPTIEAFERVIRNYRGGVILTSHDRDFIENIGVTEQVELRL